MRRLLILAAFALAGSAYAQERLDGFEDPALDARYREFLHTLRCLQCMNQSIAESPSDTAGDVRREVHERMAEGQSNQEIRAFLVSRYGDFISYQPPFRPSTWILWAAPALLLIGGGLVFVRILGKRMNQPLDEDLE